MFVSVRVESKLSLKGYLSGATFTRFCAIYLIIMKNNYYGNISNASNVNIS